MRYGKWKLNWESGEGIDIVDKVRELGLFISGQFFVSDSQGWLVGLLDDAMTDQQLSAFGITELSIQDALELAQMKYGDDAYFDEITQAILTKPRPK